jgi:hypothetical protein
MAVSGWGPSCIIMYQDYFQEICLEELSKYWKLSVCHLIVIGMKGCYVIWQGFPLDLGMYVRACSSDLKINISGLNPASSVVFSSKTACCGPPLKHYIRTTYAMDLVHTFLIGPM